MERRLASGATAAATILGVLVPVSAEVPVPGDLDSDGSVDVLGNLSADPRLWYQDDPARGASHLGASARKAPNAFDRRR
ncbi:hypothetical protein BH10ACT1_BH10ACT1_25320 [soil metagenome]